MLDIIVIIIIDRLALVRHTFNRCELLCNFTITQLTLNKVIQFNSMKPNRFGGFGVPEVAILRYLYFNFEPSLKLRWWYARDLFGPQIPVTNSQFQTWLQVEVSQQKSATTVVRLRIQVLRIRLTYQASWPSGLGNYFACKKFAVQTLLWSLEFVIETNPEHDTIAVSNLARSRSIHKNHFFRLHEKYKSSESKVKFRQARNLFKRFLEATKLAHANKTKESITSLKIGSRNFWRIVNSVLKKGKSAIPPLFNGPEVLPSASDKAKLLKTFLRTLISTTQVSLYLFSFQN